MNLANLDGEVFEFLGGNSVLEFNHWPDGVNGDCYRRVLLVKCETSTGDNCQCPPGTTVADKLQAGSVEQWREVKRALDRYQLSQKSEDAYVSAV